MNEIYAVASTPPSDAVKWSTEALIPAEPWMRKRACTLADAEKFFPAEKAPKYAEEAKKVCHRCPVMDECLDYALRNREDDGVWGGKTAQERLSIRARKLGLS